jgi:hypothetical protein
VLTAFSGVFSNVHSIPIVPVLIPLNLIAVFFIWKAVRRGRELTAMAMG